MINNPANYEEIKDYWLLEPVGGLGEAFVAACLMKTFKAEKGGKVLFLTTSQSKYDLLKTFKDIDELFLLNPYTDAPVLQELINNNKIIDINIYKEDSYLATDMIDRTEHCLGLEGDSYLTKPVISKEDKTIAKDAFEKLGLQQGKTIFLSPYANSCNFRVITERFWSKLADELIKRGFEVVFNVDENSYANYKKVYLPINQIIPFADLCTHVLSFRSGLIDVIAGTTTAKLMVLYAGNNQQFSVAFTNEDLINITKKFYKYDDNIGLAENFLNMELINTIAKGSDIEQIIFDGDEENLLNYIIELCLNSKKTNT